MPGKCIPVEYIQRLVDLLLKTAEDMQDGPMKNAVVLRASIYLDLLEQWSKN